MRAISAMNAGAQYDEDGVIGLDDDPDMRVVPLGRVSGTVVGVVTGCASA
jgi:hypothetical protein